MFDMGNRYDYPNETFNSNIPRSLLRALSNGLPKGASIPFGLLRG